jgi:signal transduction histidine kinase
MDNDQFNKSKASILIVDDTADNLRLLARILTNEGYTVRPARNGPIALSSAQAIPPDLILLDIMMPDMDGYEVCKCLKADKRTCDIPIIFITALNEVVDKVKAFSVGGVDYITKPFQAEEVAARVEIHLALRQTQQHLQEQIAELDAFAHTVAHDLKGPLGIIIGYADFLTENVSTIDRDELADHLRIVQRTGRKAINIIEEILLLASVRKADVKTYALNMASIVEQAQKQLEPMINEYQGELVCPSDWPTAIGYAPWIEEVWVNYLSNGLKYGGQPPHLELGATPQPDGMIRFWVRDNGNGLAPEEQVVLFAEFNRLNKVRAEGHGLGLSIVQRIIHKLGGQVGVECKVGQGSTFYFTLPGL